MTLDGGAYREVMSRLPAAVSIVTTLDEEGRPFGFTASSVGAVSLRPPLVLVCVGRTMRSHGVFEQAAQFAISVLGSAHEGLARTFATPGADKFADHPTLRGGPDGCPVVSDAVAVLHCRVHARHDGGDHTIMLGQVIGTVVGDGLPLLLHRRGYTVPVTVPITVPGPLAEVGPPPVAMAPPYARATVSAPVAVAS